MVKNYESYKELISVLKKLKIPYVDNKKNVNLAVLSKNDVRIYFRLDEIRLDIRPSLKERYEKIRKQLYFFKDGLEDARGVINPTPFVYTRNIEAFIMDLFCLNGGEDDNICVDDSASNSISSNADKKREFVNSLQLPKGMEAKWFGDTGRIHLKYNSKGFALIDLRSNYYHFSTRISIMDDIGGYSYRVVTNQRANAALVERIPYSDTDLLYKVVDYIVQGNGCIKNSAQNEVAGNEVASAEHNLHQTRGQKMNSIVLETRKVGEIKGRFYVPSYQRGYRWGKDEVNRLLDDIYSIHESESEGIKSYCLQPIVVKKDGDLYRLIDGQQRLTTIYLIYKYMNIASNGFVDEPGFSIEYQTRDKSEKFLQHMDLLLMDDNIDFWYMGNAYKTIHNWFEKKGPKSVMSNVNRYFDENVKVIWYEVGEDEDEIGLFTRLNIGKIPLTSSELVKAMFLNNAYEKTIGRHKQEEIAYQWDGIEKELHDEHLWFFLANCSDNNYATRIDLVLSLMSRSDYRSGDYDTFYYFDELRKQKGIDDIWKDIQHAFLTLKDWFRNHELYHKIGYIIASGYCSLSEVYEFSKEKAKSEFLGLIDDIIRDSVWMPCNYGSLRYGRKTDEDAIQRLLLLFNIESVRRNGEKTEWFPFEKYKEIYDGHTVWTLEHIHAQQSQGMNTVEEWQEWIALQLHSIEYLAQQSPEDEELMGLMDDMYEALDKERIIQQEFEEIQKKVFSYLSEDNDLEYMHSISNLALLNSRDNAALNNSTFDVKRNEIIKMDMQGKFIPFCTKMAFLKYYSKSEINQLHFWSKKDRYSYIEEMNRVLEGYLHESISCDWEEY